MSRLQLLVQPSSTSCGLSFLHSRVSRSDLHGWARAISCLFDADALLPFQRCWLCDPQHTHKLLTGMLPTGTIAHAVGPLASAAPFPSQRIPASTNESRPTTCHELNSTTRLPWQDLLPDCLASSVTAALSHVRLRNPSDHRRHGSACQRIACCDVLGWPPQHTLELELSPFEQNHKDWQKTMKELGEIEDKSGSLGQKTLHPGGSQPVWTDCHCHKPAWPTSDK